MTRPLILMVYERVLPGGQLVHRLQDMGYRVSVLNNPAQLLAQSQSERPLLVLVDLALKSETVRLAVQELRAHPSTAHIPVIAYAPAQNPELLRQDQTPGATLSVADGALLVHLDQILDQALQID